MNLNGIEVPAHYNGVGLHDTPGSETAVWPYEQSRVHAQELRAHGVTLYKLFGSGTKGVRASAYRDNGIVVLHRWWPGGAHWGKLASEWLMPKEDYDYLLSCGVSLFEPGWNEFNIADEWVVPIPNAEAIAHEVLNAWEAAGARYGGYQHLLFPSNTPGGHVDHRACYRAIVAEISRRGMASTIKHVAIHPRPLNNPPYTQWTATNTCTFDEWRWIRDQFRSVGVNAYYWATEHGYSIDYCENAEWPCINLDSWTNYNWTLFTGMNPAHQGSIEPEFAGMTYWYNAGWGHWGFWARDALVDSPAPEMPAPSPLWIKMGNEASSLSFSRYEGTTPVIERAMLLDISQFSGSSINFPLVKADGYVGVFIRATGPNADRTKLIVDTQWDNNYNGAAAEGLLIGAYHGLMQEPTGQAKLFVDTVADRPLELGYWGDFEGVVTDAKAGAFLFAADRNLAEWGIERPVCDVYTSLGWLSGKEAAWAPGRNLWLAAWTYDLGVTPKIPAQWAQKGFTFWQWSNKGSVPGVPNRVCLDVYKGTQEELYEEYGEPENNGGDDMAVEIVDRNGLPVTVDGKLWTWETVQRDFGITITRATPPEGKKVLRLTKLVYDSSADTNWKLRIVDDNGAPVSGKAAFLGINPPSGQDLPADMAPILSENVQAQPEGRPNRAIVLQPNEANFTDVIEGCIQHSLGTGSNYIPPILGGLGGGTHWAWGTEFYTDVPAGFGMWDNHKMFWPVFTLTTEGDEPTPPTPTPTGKYKVTGTITLDLTVEALEE